MSIDLKLFSESAAAKSRENRRFLSSLKKKNARKIDDVFHDQHVQVFDNLNCLDCGNCCKTTSPIFYSHDIDRASKALNMKPGDFTQQYLRIDDDGDYVLRLAPCPFLATGNICRIYDHRPRACREYPHTHRKKMVQLLDLTYRNTLVCPAVFEIVERLKSLNL